MAKVISIPKGAKNTPVPSKRTVGVPDDAPHPLTGLHVGGIAVDMLPPERLVGLFWAQTDEGIAANNVGKSATSARVTRDPLQKALDAKRDFSQNENEPWLAPDPMRPLAEAHVAPGMRARFLSEGRLAKEGNYTRGFEVVRAENGDPIKLGTLVLAQMPEEKAEKRNQYFQDKGNAKVQQVYETARQQSEGAVRTARDLGLPLPAGEEYQFEDARITS